MKKSRGVKALIRECIPHEMEVVLLKRKAMTKYINNTYKRITGTSDIEKIINEKKKQKDIRDKVKRCTKELTSSFLWMDTPEGFNFWNKIDEEIRCYKWSLQ